MWMPSQKKGHYCSRDCQITDSLKQKIASGNYSKTNAYTYIRRTRKYECESCGNSGEWLGQEMSLHIDHIDGNHSNHSVDNMRYLCPNCHACTSTYSNRNVSEQGKQRIREAALIGNAIQNGKLPKGTRLGSKLAVQYLDNV